MKVYHGSYTEIETIDLNKCQANKRQIFFLNFLTIQLTFTKKTGLRYINC